MRTVALLMALAGSLAPRAAAHHNGAFQTASQAETNVAKAVIVATIKNPRLGATFSTRVRCTGIGTHIGTRYNHFICTIAPWKGASPVIYHALPGGHYTLSLP